MALAFSTPLVIYPISPMDDFISAFDTIVDSFNPTSHTEDPPIPVDEEYYGFGQGAFCVIG